MFVGSLRLIAVLLIAFALVACGGTGGNQGPRDTDRATAAETGEAEETDEPAETDESESTDEPDEPDETDEPEGTDEPDETDEPGGGDGQEGDISVFDLEPGTCFNVPDEDASSFEEVPAVPCDEEHQYEVFALVEHDAGADDEYPGDEDLDDFAFAGCEEEFEGYVGTEYSESIYYINYLTPSEDTWAEGDREVVCVVYQRDEDQNPEVLTGSARDSEE